MRSASSLEGDVRTQLAGIRRVVLAVSGGIDSMVLLHAVTRVAPKCEVVVATFDHGTGAAARASVDVVRRVAARGGLTFECARLGDVSQERPELPDDHEIAETRNDEATWRRARWRFLHAVAFRYRSSIATAHTLDDHIETVAMRIIRGAGARGLAALHAESTILRPLLARTRREIVSYASANDVSWCEDPSNSSRRYLRNRVRHDLLPAIAAVRPGFANELLEISERATDVRRRIDELLPLVAEIRETSVRVSRQTMKDIPIEARPFVWQALAGRAGVVLDRRGTSRLAETTPTLRKDGRVPLSGGFEVVADDSWYTFRRTPSVETSGAPLSSLNLSRVTRFGAWRFSPVTESNFEGGGGAHRPTASRDGAATAWFAWLPANVELALRSWKDGDRIATDGTTPKRRRVKRFFSDLRIPSSERTGWPVVLLGDEIIWIPGIRRTYAATDRSGRPGVCILCERIDG